MVQNKEQELLKEQEQARVKLVNMQLCNICNLEEFTCDYPELVLKYLTKLPIIGEASLEEFLKTSRGG